MANPNRAVFLLLLICIPIARPADLESHTILEQVRQKVAAQMQRSANYTCVETLDRSYLRPTRFTPASCGPAQMFDLQEIMHDRLRLNMAISKSGEIFSWYAEGKFTNGKINSVVEDGPISSGSFVGFLGNIFIRPGISFSYRGKSKEHGVAGFRFDYAVPQTASQFRVEGAQGQRAVVPFHGSFTVSAVTFELRKLRIESGQIPASLRLCRTESEVHYQIENISGFRTLVPESYELRINDDNHMYTISKGKYSQCREYQAQSTLRFDTPKEALSRVNTPALEKQLPAGLRLSIELLTRIDSRTNFAGDPVEGVLTAPLLGKDGTTILPANTILQGIVTQLNTIYGSQVYSTARIVFRRALTAGMTYSLHSVYDLSDNERQRLRSISGDVLTSEAKDEIAAGTIVQTSGRLRLDRSFHGIWRTVSEQAASSRR